MPPKQLIPDYSYIQERGNIAGRAIQNIGNIAAATIPPAVQEYQKVRSLKTAYKGVRGMVLDQQEKYGLNDKQADALMQKLKFRDGETVDAYEKRIAPTLSNLMQYDEYSKSAEYKVDMPNPFMESDAFAAAIDMNLQKRRQQELGHVTQELPDDATRESATQEIAGRMPGRAVGEKELEQFPAYRSLPTQSDVDSRAKAHSQDFRATGTDMRAEDQNARAEDQNVRSQEMHGMNMKLKQAQLEATKTSTRLKKLAATQNPKGEVDALKNMADIVKLEVSAKELLKDIPRNDEISGELNEDWVNMKALSDLLAQKRREAAKVPETSPEAQSAAMRIQDDVSKHQMTPEKPEDMANVAGQNQELARNITVQKIQQFAQENGVNIPSQKINESLRMKNPQTGQPYTVEEVMDRILKIKAMQTQGSQPIGGRVGR